MFLLGKTQFANQQVDCFIWLHQKLRRSCCWV